VKSWQKKQKLFHRETPKTPRFAEKIPATLGDFGEVRRMNIFLFGSGSSGLGYFHT
jgi:hypothetical protein